MLSPFIIYSIIKTKGGNLMKLCMVIVTAIFLFCGSTYAADDCDSKYVDLINGLKNTDKIRDEQKKKYLQPLETALQLCKEGKMKQASEVMDDVKDEFFRDALLHQRDFFGH
jgi:hypothetical protein